MIDSVQNRVSEEEWALRLDLAAAYNLASLLRMSDQITASSLIKVNIDGEVLFDETGLGINPAGFVIHSTIHAARHDAHCVMHTHTAAGIAVSAQRQGLLMISQHA